MFIFFYWINVIFGSQYKVYHDVLRFCQIHISLGLWLFGVGLVQWPLISITLGLWLFGVGLVQWPLISITLGLWLFGVGLVQWPLISITVGLWLFRDGLVQWPLISITLCLWLFEVGLVQWPLISIMSIRWWGRECWLSVFWRLWMAGTLVLLEAWSRWPWVWSCWASASLWDWTVVTLWTPPETWARVSSPPPLDGAWRCSGTSMFKKY